MNHTITATTQPDHQTAARDWEATIRARAFRAYMAGKLSARGLLFVLKIAGAIGAIRAYTVTK